MIHRKLLYTKMDEKCMEFNKISIIVQTMKQQPTNSQYNRKAIQALKTLAIKNKQNQDFIASCGAISVIASAMRHNLEDLQLQHEAMITLVAIGKKNPEIIKRMQKLQLVPVVQASVQKHAELDQTFVVLRCLLGCVEE